MNARILVADDAPGVRRMLESSLKELSYDVTCAADGQAALESARRDPPDLVLLDIDMPRMSGWDVLKELRRGRTTRGVPVIVLTGLGEVDDRVEGFDLGADDYLIKPFPLSELAARVARTLRRTQQDLGAHPLTRLPGSPSIQRDVEERIARREEFALLHADIDRFKSFNDAYGFAAGDRLILLTAEILAEATASCAGENAFLGHIGGDDFALVCSPGRADGLAERAVREFDRLAPSLYAPEDRAKGFVETHDRTGELRRWPLAALTIAGVRSIDRAIDSYSCASQYAAEVKGWLKARPDAARGAWSLDRRRDRAAC